MADTSLNIPPASELMDFESFVAAMNAGPIDDVHKYFDSDDEQDLESNFDGEDSEAESNKENYRPRHGRYLSSDESLCSADHEDVQDDGQVYDMVDTRQVDRSKLSPSHAESHYLDPELQDMVDRTQSVLEQLSIEAQSIIEEQPLSTQIVLANQAHDQVFRPYAQHGSQARFGASVMKFLGGGDTVRRPGKDGRKKAKDGRLRLAEIDPLVRGADEVRSGRRTFEDESDEEAGGMLDMSKRSDLGTVVKKRKGNTGMSVSLGQEEVDISRQGAAQLAESLSFRKTSDPVSEWETRFGIDQDASIGFTTPQPRTISQDSTLVGETLFTPLAENFSSSLNLDIPSDVGQNIEYLQYPEAYSCTYHPKANADLAKEEYTPVSLDLSWQATTSSGAPCMPTPGLLDSLNRIIHLTNAEGRFMLSYYVRKYETPLRLGGRSSGIEPPHALFRLGISQYLHSKVDSFITHQDHDELGLTPEARRVLGEAWERHPSIQTWFGEEIDTNKWLSEDEDEHGPASDGTREERSPLSESTTSDADTSNVPTKGGLNPLEKALLARACAVSTGTVDAYWNMMREKTFAWAAMKQWCQARTLEKINLAKAEGIW